MDNNITGPSRPNLRQAFSPMKAYMNLFDEVMHHQGIKDFRSSEGSIRIDLLLNTSNNLKFIVSETGQNVATALATTQALRQGDSFMPVSLGMFLSKVAVASPSTPPTPLQLAQSKWYTWPNPWVFNGGPAVAIGPATLGTTIPTEALMLQALYKGQIVSTVNSTNVSDYMDTHRFYRVGIAQEGINVSPVDAFPPVINKYGYYFADEWTGNDYGLTPWHQDMCYNGKQSSSIVINLTPNAALNFVPATGSADVNTVNMLTVFMRGVLAQNASDHITDKSINVFFEKSGGPGGHPATQNHTSMRDFTRAQKS